MRITDSMHMGNIVRQASTLATRMADASKRATTGLKINAPSDDPIAAAQLARVQASIGQTNDYVSTITAVRGDIEQTESSLSIAEDVLQRVKELTLQGTNPGLSAQDRTSMAQEIRAIREQMLGIANQQGSNGYLFGGTKTNVAPFAPDGTYNGDPAARQAEVAPNVLASVNVVGDAVFKPTSGRDIFKDLEDLYTALSSNDVPGVTAQIDNIDAGYRQILAARSDAGLTLARLDAADAAHQQTNATLTIQGHNLADADPYEAYSQLTATQNSIEQSVAVSKSILDTLSIRRF